MTVEGSAEEIGDDVSILFTEVFLFVTAGPLSLDMLASLHHFPNTSFD